MPDFTVVNGCRSCGSSSLVEILDLGSVPLADGLVPPGGTFDPDDVFPLTTVFCEDCTLVQIRETVPPKRLFGDDYPYYSSFSDELVAHAKQNVDEILELRKGVPTDLAVEVASNDGYLLQFFRDAGVSVLGIDPAPGPVAAARDRGIETQLAFFDAAYAERLVEDGVRADVVIGNNVLAHVENQNSFVEGVATLLRPGGLARFEFPWVADLVEKCEFDTIYHQHACYFSVHSVQHLFQRHGLDLVDVQHHRIHGGSLRCTFSAGGVADPSVQAFLDDETRRGVDTVEFYSDFATRVTNVKQRLLTLLDALPADASIAGYGAAAKGTTMLAYTGIAPRLSFVVDRNVHKHGWSMPGTDLVIRPVEDLLSERPDFVVVLAWNFIEEIARQQRAYLDGGGRFIVPIPEPRLLDA